MSRTELPLCARRAWREIGHSVHVVRVQRGGAAWFAASATALLLALALFSVAVRVSTRTFMRNGAPCGSVVKPIDAEVVGPPGTNPRPCEGTHATDTGIALALVAGAGALTFAVVRSRPGRAVKTAAE